MWCSPSIPCCWQWRKPYSCTLVENSQWQTVFQKDQRNLSAFYVLRWSAIKETGLALTWEELQRKLVWNTEAFRSKGFSSPPAFLLQMVVDTQSFQCLKRSSTIETNQSSPILYCKLLFVVLQKCFDQMYLAKLTTDCSVFLYLIFVDGSSFLLGLLCENKTSCFKGSRTNKTWFPTGFFLGGSPLYAP